MTVGDLDLHSNRLVIPGDHGLSLTTYTAEPGTASAEGLRLLGSWAASEERQTSTADEAKPYSAP